MDTIALSARKIEGESDTKRMGKEAVDILINGRDIREMVYKVESFNLAKEGNGSKMSGYGSLDLDFVFLPCRNLLGEPGRKLYPYMVDDGRVRTLRCICGDIDCEPAYVRVTPGGDWVIWSDIGNPAMGPEYREKPRDYSSLHFVFDREQYLPELSEHCLDGRLLE